MSELPNESGEFDTSWFNFSQKIDAIASRKLTAKNLNNYADDALGDFISVIEDAKKRYSRQPTVVQGTSKGNEIAAFEYLGLDPDYIDIVLDHIVSKADEIHNLDLVAARIMQHVNRVIVSPNAVKPEFIHGDGLYEKKFEPRLNTVLFLLSNSFNIDLENADELRLTAGIVDSSIMRDESYRMLDLPTLNRIILVCDEVGNATFVLDSAIVKQLGINSEMLTSLSKDELSNMFFEHPKSGSRIIQSDSFVEDVINLLEDIPAADQTIARKKVVNTEFLRPKGVISGAAVANKINEQYGSSISHQTIYKVADQLNEEGLINLEKHNFGPKRLINGYTDSDVRAIIAKLDEMDLLYPKAPDGMVSLTGLVSDAIDWGNPDYKEIFNNVLSGVEQKFGALQKYRFVSASSFGVSPEQLPIAKALIDDHVYRIRALIAAKKLHTEMVAEERELSKRPEQHPEGYKTLTQIGAEKGVSSKIYDQAFENVVDRLGEIAHYTHGPRGYRSFTLEQQRIIGEEIDTLKTSERTPGRLTANEIAVTLKVRSDLVRQLLKEQNTPFLIEKVHNKPSPTYDAGIADELSRNALVIRLANLPPAFDGVVSLNAFAKSHHKSNETVEKITRKYHMPLGEFGFGPRSRPAVGLLPQDQRFIEQELEE